jgi:hypothetical protein
MSQTQLNNVLDTSNNQEDVEQILNTITDLTKGNSLATTGIQLLMDIKYHEKLRLLLHDDHINDGLKLNICRYFIKERIDVAESVGNILYNIIKRNTCPKEPVDLDDAGRKNWNNFWKIAIAVAASLNTQPKSDGDNLFRIDVKDICVILKPRVGDYSISICGVSPDLFGKVTTAEAIISKLRQKKVIQ